MQVHGKITPYYNMTTSNSTNFNPTANEIITEALEQLGVIGLGDAVDGDVYESCLRSLNMMIKAWQSQGLHLWSQTEAIVFLNEDQIKYQLGGTGPDKASLEIIKTQLAADQVTSDTALTVDSTADMAVSDVIGIVQDDDTIKWTTIATIPSSTTLTISSGLASAASTDQNVYAYTTAYTDRPLEIVSCRLIRDDDTVFPMRILSRSEYFNIPGRTTTSNSTPSQWYADMQRDHTDIYIYPASDTAQSRLQLTVKRIFEDFDSSTDTSDFPQEWVSPIALNLAVYIAPKFSKEDKVAAGLGQVATAHLQSLKEWDSEKASLKIRPRLDWY